MTAISGDWPRGVAMAEKANALNADAASGWYHATLYSNYYLTGDFERGWAEYEWRWKKRNPPPGAAS